MMRIPATTAALALHTGTDSAHIKMELPVGDREARFAHLFDNLNYIGGPAFGVDDAAPHLLEEDMFKPTAARRKHTFRCGRVGGGDTASPEMRSR